MAFYGAIISNNQKQFHNYTRGVLKSNWISIIIQTTEFFILNKITKLRNIKQSFAHKYIGFSSGIHKSGLKKYSQLTPVSQDLSQCWYDSKLQRNRESDAPPPRIQQIY